MFCIFFNFISKVVAAADLKLCSQLFQPSHQYSPSQLSIDNNMTQHMLELKLSQGEILLPSEPVGIGKFGAHFVKYKDGIEGVWKANRKTTILETALSEVAAFRIDRYLGLNKVPVTVEKNLNNTKGTVQYRLRNLKKLPEGKHYLWFPDELGFFDYLISNGDRLPDNILLTVDGHPVAIDNGLGFIPGNGVEAFNRFQFLVKRFIRMLEIQKEVEARLEIETQEVQKKILQQGINRNINDQQIIQLSLHAFVPSSEIVERLRTTTFSDWKNLVGDLLSDLQLQELITRQQSLIQAIDFAVEHLGAERIYPTGPKSSLLKFQN